MKSLKANSAIILLMLVYNCLSCQSDIIMDVQSTYKEDLAKFNKFENSYAHTIQTSNGEIHFYTMGDFNQPTILWLHGMFGSSYDFIEPSIKFLESGYSSIAIDYYGHGQTTRPSSDVSIYDMADDIKEILDSLKVGQINLVGISRGGTIASAFYDDYPDYVKSITLVDGGSVQWTYQVQRLGEVESRRKIGMFQVPT